MDKIFVILGIVLMIVFYGPPLIYAYQLITEKKETPDEEDYCEVEQR